MGVIYRKKAGYPLGVAWAVSSWFLGATKWYKSYPQKRSYILAI